jgi:hypothetical protein
MVRHADGGPADLDPWVGFPVTQVPRPVVLLSPPVQLGEGFVDGDSKLAWLTGSIVTDVPLPAGVLELVTDGHSEHSAPTVLHISAVERCSGDFLCDRGSRALPAYRLTADGLRAGCVVLDPDVDCWWPSRAHRPPPGRPARSAHIEPDDRIIHFPASGGVLTEFHHAEFVEYETCVVGRAVTSERQVPPGTAVHAVGITKHVTGRLERPLAGRVLLNNNGAPLAVLPTGDDRA